MATPLEMLQESANLDLDELQSAQNIAETGDYDLLTEEELAAIQALKPQKESKFGENLAERLTESERNAIAQDVIQRFMDDDESRLDWRDREAKGIRKLGVTEKVDGQEPFPGASRACHPLLIEAAIQFQARAIQETWPANGPAKGIVLGDSTEETEEQAERVGTYLNYLYVYDMPDAFEEHDLMLFRLPISGSTFKKTYYCPIEGQIVSRFVAADDLVVPYSATTLRTSTRYTHRVLMSPSNVQRMMHSGTWMDVELSPPYESEDTEDLEDAEDDADGRSRRNYLANDNQYTILEQYTEYDLPGIDDDVPYDSRYIITVDMDSQKVLAIYRNWNEDDPLRKQRMWFTHYKFLPGLGFYGFGFLHIIGGLSDAATGALRALLDSGQFANLQGGYKSRDSRIPGGDEPIAPGEWREVDSSAEDLHKAFMPLPFKEPSSVLFNLLGTLDELGRRLASTTEASVGEGSQAMPVGTILARIEQGAKVYTAIHKRLHRAMQGEFKIVARLCYENLPEDGYPYAIEGESREIMAEDFDERVDVAPVSDPNLVSSTHRVMQGQALMEMMQADPQEFNKPEVYGFILETLRVQGHEKFLAKGSMETRKDPVAEGMAMMRGDPVKAFVDQDHQAHMIVHQTWFQGLEQDLQQALMPVYMAHHADHMAWTYWLQIQQAIGGQLPMPDEDTELSAQEEGYLSGLVAQAVQQMPPAPTPQQQEQDREQQAHEAEIARKDAAAQADIDRKDAVATAEQVRKDHVAGLEANRTLAKTQAEQARKDLESQAQSERQDAQTISEIERKKAQQATRGE
jgi:chaperonin GroES